MPEINDKKINYLIEKWASPFGLLDVIFILDVKLKNLVDSRKKG